MLYYYRSKYIEHPDDDPEPYEMETWGWDEIHALMAKERGVEAPCYKTKKREED